MEWRLADAKNRFSELVSRPKGHPGVRRVVEALESDSLFVSVVSIGEIAKGIALLTSTATN